VLLFHELGHYIGMRLFNYQDVKMFFIPFFGAAVAGRSRSVHGYKEAIVILLGPLPGIILGGVLGIVGTINGSELLRSAAVLFLFINGFNLLPFMPLDGGRLLHLVLFSRQPHLEALFRVLTGGLMAFAGFSMGGWYLGGLGVFIVLGTPHLFRVSQLAKKLRGPLQTGEVMDLSARIPFEQAVPLVELVRKRFPRLHDPKLLANTVLQIWERIHLRPPGLAASILLLMAYGIGFLAAPAFTIAMSRPVRAVAMRVDQNGQPVRTREERVWGRLRKSTELNDKNQPNGRYFEYDVPTGRITVEGSYVNGLRDGTWKTFDRDGQVQSIRHFRHGIIQLNPPLPIKPEAEQP